MESSQPVWVDAEECHSSESGWTMYIDSPVHHDDDNDDDDDDDVVVDDDDVDDHHDHEQDVIEDDDDDEGYGYGAAAKHESDSDDSMVSDASSGPTHQGHQPCGNYVAHGHENIGYGGSFEKGACQGEDDDGGARRRRRRKGEKQGRI